MVLVLAINVFFMIYFWNRSSEAFEEGRNGMGFVDLFFSALNGVVVINYFI